MREPVGDVYAALLALARERCSSFSLVWREQLDHNDAACEVQLLLRPHLDLERRTDRWPGTELLGHFAKIRYYAMNEETAGILADNAAGLYRWLSPDRPEDLALYRAERSCWLGSIAHEKDAWIEDPDLTIEELRRRVQGLEVQAQSHGE